MLLVVSLHVYGSVHLVIGGGGGGGGVGNLTPWNTDINAAGHSLTNAGTVSAGVLKQNGTNLNDILSSISNTNALSSGQAATLAHAVTNNQPNVNFTGTTTNQAFASDANLIYSSGAGLLHVYNLVDAGTLSASAGQFTIDLLGNVIATSFSGSGTNLTGIGTNSWTAGAYAWALSLADGSGTYNYLSLSNTPTLGNAASASTNTMKVASATNTDYAADIGTNSFDRQWNRNSATGTVASATTATNLNGPTVSSMTGNGLNITDADGSAMGITGGGTTIIYNPLSAVSPWELRNTNNITQVTILPSGITASNFTTLGSGKFTGNGSGLTGIASATTATNLGAKAVINTSQISSNLVFTGSGALSAHNGNYTLVYSNTVVNQGNDSGSVPNVPWMVWKKIGGGAYDFVSLNDQTVQQNFFGTSGPFWTVGPSNDVAGSDDGLCSQPIPSTEWFDPNTLNNILGVFVYFSQTTNLNPSLAYCPNTNASTRYVDAVIGSDLNDGLTSATPFATIGRAFSFAGVTNVLVGPGNYPESIYMPSRTTLRGAGIGQTIFRGAGAGGVSSVVISDECIISDVSFYGQMAANNVTNWAIFRNLECAYGDNTNNIDCYVGGLVTGALTFDQCYLHGVYDIFAFQSGNGGTYNIVNCRIEVKNPTSNGAFPVHGYQFTGTNITVNIYGGSLTLTNGFSLGGANTNGVFCANLGLVTFNVYGLALNTNSCPGVQWIVLDGHGGSAIVNVFSPLLGTNNYTGTFTGNGSGLTGLLTYAHSVVIPNLAVNTLYTNGAYQSSLIGGIVLQAAVATGANVTFISTTGTITNWPFQSGLEIAETNIVGMNIPIDPNQIFYLTNYAQGSLTNANLIR